MLKSLMSLVLVFVGAQALALDIVVDGDNVNATLVFERESGDTYKLKSGDFSANVGWGIVKYPFESSMSKERKNLVDATVTLAGLSSGRSGPVRVNISSGGNNGALDTAYNGTALTMSDSQKRLATETVNTLAKSVGQVVINQRIRTSTNARTFLPLIGLTPETADAQLEDPSMNIQGVSLSSDLKTITVRLTGTAKVRLKKK